MMTTIDDKIKYLNKLTKSNAEPGAIRTRAL